MLPAMALPVHKDTSKVIVFLDLVPSFEGKHCRIARRFFSLRVMLFSGRRLFESGMVLTSNGFKPSICFSWKVDLNHVRTGSYLSFGTRCKFVDCLRVINWDLVIINPTTAIDFCRKCFAQELNAVGWVPPIWPAQLPRKHYRPIRDWFTLAVYCVSYSSGRPKSWRIHLSTNTGCCVNRLNRVIKRRVLAIKAVWSELEVPSSTCVRQVESVRPNCIRT